MQNTRPYVHPRQLVHVFALIDRSPDIFTLCMTRTRKNSLRYCCDRDYAYTHQGLVGSDWLTGRFVFVFSSPPHSFVSPFFFLPDINISSRKTDSGSESRLFSLLPTGYRFVPGILSRKDSGPSFPRRLRIEFEIEGYELQV